MNKKKLKLVYQRQHNLKKLAAKIYLINNIKFEEILFIKIIIKGNFLQKLFKVCIYLIFFAVEKFCFKNKVYL